MSLFFKECKKVFFSIPYLILILTLIGFVYSQDVFPNFDSVIEAPSPNHQNYGTKASDIGEIIMPRALDSLYGEFSFNQYTTYPIGFYKNVKLNDKKQAEIAEILSTLSGIDSSEFKKIAKVKDEDSLSINIGDGSDLSKDENGNPVITLPESTQSSTTNIESITPKADLSYNLFLEEMKKADNILGSGSKYSEVYLKELFGQIPITYEEALIDYNTIKSRDKFTGAYARLFCDYIGIMLALLPAFVAVALSMKDGNSKISALLYTRKASSLHIISSRYLAIVAMIMLPTILLCYIPNINIWASHSGEILDYLAPLKYSLVWLMPSIMISTIIGMFFTILTDTPIAIAVQCLWWFLDLFKYSLPTLGIFNYFTLIPRHNSYGNAEIFANSFNAFVINRSILMGISILLLFATIYLYEQKRKGHLNGYEHIKTIFRNSKNKSKA